MRGSEGDAQENFDFDRAVVSEDLDVERDGYIGVSTRSVTDDTRTCLSCGTIGRARHDSTTALDLTIANLEAAIAEQ